MHLQSGTLLERGKYRIISTLGRGGFGVTYLAEQVSLRRRVCIKEFFPKDYYKRNDDDSLTVSSDGFAEMMDKFKAKFIKEAQTIAALDHPNIIHIHDVFEENGTAYYVMDYIEGEPLSELVKSNGAMSERDAAAYIKQIAAALEHIHDRKINHLDVKPGNIMVRREDNRAILIDFGLSKHYDAESGEATSTTPVGVSHGYAPMEQYKQGGVSKFSPETDIYSLGATLYYLVTGSVPPQAADIGKDGIGELPSELSSNVCVAIRKSMSYWKEDRPHTIKEFMALLDNKVVKPKPKKSRWLVWLLGLLLIGGGAWFIFGDNKGDDKYAEMIARGLGRDGVYEVGDYYNRNGKEGVVFEVSDGGRHGKIVSLDETDAPWDSCAYSDATGTKTGANSMSDGKANTDKIMNRSDSEYFEACVWCREKGDDWYLPAREELKTIYNNKSAINSTLAEYGGTELSKWYWSSTEYDEFCAWYVFISNGNLNYNYKDANYCVRAVSAF